MSENVQPLAEGETAQAPEVTASSEDVQSTAPGTTEKSDTTSAEEKKFSQAEIDAMISKRLAREQRKWEREQRTRQAESQYLPKPILGEISEDQFDSKEKYIQALAEKRAREIFLQKEAFDSQAKLTAAYEERADKFREAHDDFDQVVGDQSLQITDVMAEAIFASDIGPEVAYYLGTNPKTAERISKLSPFLQAKEIGRIEAKLAEAPPPAAKKTSSAPAPISPVTARSTVSPVFDTTDPRSTQSMSTEEWVKAELRRREEKLRRR